MENVPLGLRIGRAGSSLSSRAAWLNFYVFVSPCVVAFIVAPPAGSFPLSGGAGRIICYDVTSKQAHGHTVLIVMHNYDTRRDLGPRSSRGVVTDYAVIISSIIGPQSIKHNGS